VIAWVKSKGYFDEFSEITNGLLESVGDLHLSFLDVESIRDGSSGKGWISAKYIAFARLLPWFVGCLAQVPEPAAYVPPLNRPSPGTWTKKECTDWLKAFGYKVGKINADQARARVADIQKVAKKAKKVLHQVPKTGPYSDLLAASTSLTSLVSELMAEETSTPSIARVELLVKVFLHDFVKFSDPLKGIAVSDREVVDLVVDDVDGEMLDDADVMDLHEDSDERDEECADERGDERVEECDDDDAVEAGEEAGGDESGDEAGDEAGDKCDGKETGADHPQTTHTTTHRTTRGKRASIPTWISCYNFLGLLLLAEQLWRLGPVHGYWEGRLSGEKFVQVVKAELEYIKSTTKNLESIIWLQRIMDRVSIRMSLSRFLEVANSTPGEDVDTDRSRLTKAGLQGYLNRQQTVAQALLALYSGRPLSLVYFNGEFGIPIIAPPSSASPEATAVFYLPIHYSEKAPEFSTGLFYHQFEPPKQLDGSIVAVPTSSIRHLTFCCALPQLERIGGTMGLPGKGTGALLKSRYAIIDDKWCSFIDDKTFQRFSCIYKA
jgi:hypothetical protein